MLPPVGLAAFRALIPTRDLIHIPESVLPTEVASRIAGGACNRDPIGLPGDNST